MSAPTFRDAAAKFLAAAATRKRNPLRANTLATYKSQIETHLNPLIGDLTLDVIGNNIVKSVVEELSEQKRSPATISLNYTIIKKIRKSAVNSEGEELYPYKWNSEFIDLPSGESKSSLVSAAVLQGALNQNCHDIGPLIAVLAGTGLRIGEALALTRRFGAVAPFRNTWDAEESKFVIRGQRDCEVWGPTKTKAGEREVDIAPELNEYLKKQNWSEDGLFPLSEAFYRKRLVLCGITGGFHALRRFRTTHLNQMSAPTGMEYFWMGHAAKDVHGRYVNVGEEIQKRKTEAARVGLGFSVPENNA